MKRYKVQVIWNREFHWSNYGDGWNTAEEAIAYAKGILDMGDGHRVKKVQVLDTHDSDICIYPVYFQEPIESTQ